MKSRGNVSLDANFWHLQIASDTVTIGSALGLLALLALTLHLLSLRIRSGYENVRRLGGFHPRVFPMYIPLLHRGILFGGNRILGEKCDFLLVIGSFIHTNQEEEAGLQVNLNQHMDE